MKYTIEDVLISNVTLILMLMVGIWAIDIGVSGMIADAQHGFQSKAIGLFGERPAIAHYHLGLVLTMLSGFVLVVTNIIYLVRDLKNETIPQKVPSM